MTKAQEQLIVILGNQLFGAQNEPGDLDEKQLDAIMDEAKQQAVFPLVYAYLESLKHDDDTIRKYKRQKNVFTTAGIRNLHTHNLIHQLLENNGVPYVIIKGQASAKYYPNPMMRTMGDVDFLVSTEHKDHVDELLKLEGFGKSDRAEEHDFHWEYYKGKARAELHWDVPGVPVSEDETIRNYLSDIIEKRELIKMGDASFYVPADFHHGLVLLLHMISHIPKTGVGLRHLSDWLVFTESVSEAKFAELFLEPLQDMGLLTFSKILTKIGIMYFNCGKKNWCRDADEQVCTEFLEDILRGGNFGVKDEGRWSQSAVIQNKRTKGIARNSIFQNIAETISRKALKDYPICKKFSFLLPFFWNVVIVQYLLDVARGKKYSMLNKEHITAAKNRYSLYSKLRLFEK